MSLWELERDNRVSTLQGGLNRATPSGAPRPPRTNRISIFAIANLLERTALSTPRFGADRRYIFDGASCLSALSSALGW
jgi:hypothetical protein